VIAYFLARAIGLRNHATASVNALIASASATLEAEGLAALPQLASAETISAIHAYLCAQTVVSSAGETRIESLPPTAGAAAYPLKTVLAAPGVLDIANNPLVIAIASKYLGCTPTISSVGIRWSLPGNRTQIDTQLFHRDCDDWRFIKLFVYLTDVGPTTGPHVFVRGSHRCSGRMLGRPYTPADIAKDYATEDSLMVLGPTGTCFLADTYGIHRGTPPVDAPRLILQIQYSILPVFAFLYEPAAVELNPAYDPYINRLLIRAVANI
jgi:hypothetical protein